MTKVQRYKVGYYTDEWGMLIVTPRLIPDDRGFAIRLGDYFKLETELAALKAELREICAAIDDPACDLTLTTVECIKKLKAENEWQPISTAPKDNAVFLAWRKHATHPLMVRYEPSYDWFANYDGEHVYDLTHWMPLPKPPATAQGEKGCVQTD